MAHNPKIKRVQVDLPKSMIPQLELVRQRLNEESDGPIITTAAMLRQWIKEGLQRNRKRLK